MPDPIFTPTTDYGGPRDTQALERVTGTVGVAILPREGARTVTVAISRSSMYASFDLRPDVARALAAELIAAAEACESAGDPPQA